MKTVWGAAMAALVMLTASASAQSLMDQAKGVWLSRTPFCGDHVMTITGVDTKTGIIKGSFYCGQRNLTLAFAEEAVANKTMIGKIEGNKLTITGAASYQNLTFDGAKLTGPVGGTGLQEIVIAYQKK
jgi:hypothetical protein